jgi:hypothetical protein
MSRLTRVLLPIMLMGAGLACSLISTPISQVQNLASTAEAIATSIPSAIPSLPSIPDVSGFLNPTGAPASEWNGVPIMSQATAGQEFTKNTYSYRMPTMTQGEIESFYDSKLQTLGWTSEFSAATGAHGGIMVFHKDANILTITVAEADQGLVVILILS